jgi:hypothetical protein
MSKPVAQTSCLPRSAAFPVGTWEGPQTCKRRSSALPAQTYLVHHALHYCICGDGYFLYCGSISVYRGDSRHRHGSERGRGTRCTNHGDQYGNRSSAKSGCANCSRRLRRRTAINKYLSEGKGRRRFGTATERGAVTKMASEKTRTAKPAVRATCLLRQPSVGIRESRSASVGRRTG